MYHTRISSFLNNIAQLMFSSFDNMYEIESRDSLICIAVGWTAGVRFRQVAEIFLPIHSVQTGSGALLASNSTGTRGYFPGDKAAGA
jgi:hypothetical protein